MISRSVKEGSALLASLLMLAGFLVLAAAAQAQSGIRNTKHNLTPSGPGTIKEAQPTGVCVFCHTPHNASPTRALWNRQLPFGFNYQLYTSTTLKAALNQPSGTSRLCLSCHDGTLALSNVRVAPPGGPLTLAPLTGQTVLGTDLSDDHPISFSYDSALAVTRGQLADPSALPPVIHLNNNQLECTSCHDPHTDQQANFLRLNNRYGALCTACHQPTYWTGSSHASSAATWNGTGIDPWPADGYATVTENACLSCHRPHAAGHPQRLLAQGAEPTVCTVCHNGAVASKNVEAEFQTKPFYHPIQSAPWTHAPNENPLSMTRHVACMDCHNPHAANSATGVPPAIPGRLKGVQGVTLSGSIVTESSFTYEVCLKCHGLTEPSTTGLVRQYSSRNIRLKLDLINPSYHPIAATGKNTTMVSQGFEPGYDTSTIITCTSCHNNDDWTPAGSAPLGPHGSRHEPILERQQETNDPTTESAAVYAMCYKCHNRSAVINDVVHFNKHNRHVVSVGATCSVCHDAHGSQQAPHLINFMLRDRTGNTVVQPNTSGILQYTSTGVGSGTCSLKCHNRNHSASAYP